VGMKKKRAATAQARGARGSAAVAPLVARRPDSMASPSPTRAVEAKGEVTDGDARLWHPVAPHQPRPARDTPRALERGGLVPGPVEFRRALALKGQIAAHDAAHGRRWPLSRPA